MMYQYVLSPRQVDDVLFAQWNHNDNPIYPLQPLSTAIHSYYPAYLHQSCILYLCIYYLPHLRQVDDVLFAQWRDRKKNFRIGEVSVLEVHALPPPPMTKTNKRKKGNSHANEGEGSSHEHPTYQYKVHWKGFARESDSMVHHALLAR